MRARSRITGWIAAAWVVTLGAIAAPATAAEISVEVPSEEVYVGIPFTMTVTIRNATTHEQPQIPPVTGLDFGPPRQVANSGLTVIINGQEVRNDQDRQYAYPVTATAPGDYTVGPVSVVADGQTLTSRVVRFTARRAEAAGLLAVEILPKKSSVYLGEAAELTLRVWIRPYDDETYDVRLKSTDMWSLVDLGRSSWGDFSEPLQALVSDRFGRTRPLTGREMPRADPSGQVHTDYLFELAVSIWPQQAGPLAIEPVAVLMQYPQRLERSRSLLSRGQLRMAESRLVAASAAAPAVTVLPPPMEGRPDTFTGAVGRFDIRAEATPTDVGVGDPITLSLTITDRTPGGSRLETLAPPALEQNAELTENFRMPADPLAGVVRGNTKTFTQTLRARRDTVARIPPIEFAWFDPDSERFVTAATRAIPLSVSPTSTVTAGDVIGGEPAAAAPTELTELAGGLLANHTGPALLQSRGGRVLTWWHGILVFAPPLVVGLVAVGRGRALRLRHDRAWARRRTARRRALRQLDAASGVAGSAQAERVSAALGGYVADRFDLPPGAVTRADLARELERRRVADDLVCEIEAILEECERLRYARDSESGTDSIADRAAGCIDRLERERVA